MPLAAPGRVWASLGRESVTQPEQYWAPLQVAQTDVVTA